MTNFAIIIFILTTSLVYGQSVADPEEICKELINYKTDGKSFLDFQLKYLVGNKVDISQHTTKNLEESFDQPILLTRDPFLNCVGAYNRSLPVKELSYREIKPLAEKEMVLNLDPNAFNFVINAYQPASSETKMKDKALDFNFETSQNVLCVKSSKKSNTKTEEKCEDVSVVTPPVKVIVDLYQNLENSNKSAEKYSEAECNCIISKNKASMSLLKGNGPKEDALRRGKSKTKLNNIIMKSVGQKILNEYAKNYEDVSFYLNSKANVLKKNTKPESSEYGHLLCNSPKKIHEAIKENCKISDNEKQSRLDGIFNSFGDSMEKMDLGHKMTALGSQISNLNGSYKREEYDRGRFYLNKAPQVPFADNLITTLMGNPVFSDYILKSVDKAGKTPFDAVIALMTDESVQKNLTAISKDKKADINEVLKDIRIKYPDVSSYLKTPASKEDLSQIIQSAMIMHPGLNILLNDRSFFLKANPVGPKTEYASKHTILEDVEYSKNDLNDYFEGKCEEFRENIAKVVCTPDNELLNNISHQDAGDLLSGEDLLANVERSDMDLLICKSKPKNHGRSVFNDLDISKHPGGLSDFYDTKMNPLDQQTNPFSKAYKRKLNGGLEEKVINTIINDAEVRLGSSRVVAPNSFEPDIHGLFSSRNIPLFSSIKTDATPSKTPAEIRDSNVVAPVSGERTEKVLESLQGAFTGETKNTIPTNQSITNATVPFAASNSIIPNTSNITDPAPTSPFKEEITEKTSKLGKTKTTEQTKSLIDNISEEDAKTVINKVAKDSPETTSQVIDENKKELKELQSKYEALEKKYAASYGATPQFSNQSFVGNSNSISNEKNVGGGDSGPNPGSEKVGSAKFNVFETSADGSQKAASGKNIVVGKNGETINGARFDIVVNESVSTATVVSGESEADEEIYTLLLKSDPDIKTLELLKTSGVIYRFKEMKDGKLVESEKKISYSQLGPKVRDLLDLKLAKRTYSIKMLTNELLALDFLAKKKTPVKR